jgi:hypothetical protein
MLQWLALDAFVSKNNANKMAFYVKHNDYYNNAFILVIKGSNF